MNMTKIITRVTQRTILPDGDDLFSENAFTVSVVDEAGGEFVELRSLSQAGVMQFNPEEWPAIRDAIGEMMASISEHDRRREEITDKSGEQVVSNNE